MSDDKKPREFWVTTESPFTGTAHYEKQMQGIHVIEKSAYDALAKENLVLEELNKLLIDEIKAMKHPEYDPYKYEKEMASLRESLSAAIEALELIMSGLSSKGPRPIAHEALAKIKGDKV
jgi:hypothetical protein